MLNGFTNFLGENNAKSTPITSKGTLIVFEGCDGVGKTTAVNDLVDFLKKSHKVVKTKWNSSDLLSKPIKKAKDKRLLDPLLYCLLHAADLCVRYNEIILPALEDNKIVVCDRYIYTSMVRDEARGIDMEILKKLYADFRKPDLLFHCVVPVDVAFARMKKEKGFSHYGTGSDLNLAPTREQNYLKYQKILNRLYNEILPDVKNYHKLNMNRTPEKILEDLKDAVEKL